MAIVKEITRCPFCKEPVILGASKCKHCLSELNDSSKVGKKLLASLNTFRFGFALGILFALLLTLLAYLHFSSSP